MTTWQLPLLWLMLAAYTGSFMLYVFSAWSKKENMRKPALYAAYLGLLMNLAVLILRTYLIKGLPLNNGYEFGLCFAAAVMVTFVFMERKFKLDFLGLFVLPIVVLLSCWLINLDLSVEPIMPALRSYWLAIHVSAAVIAYGAFAISFAIAIAYLVKMNKAEKKELKKLDELSYKAIFVGLPFLTIMLVTGSVWAQYAWGSFWSWDPKETWALITWLIYAGYLHTRFLGWQGKRSAWLAVLGFAAVIFTLYGVSYLMAGMHSYIG
ncbi:MAG: c-type cytochrome biogenesis protein CcsB [Peptococcaceae bacterium]|nr:c-type cytochrome biogenesis protein CcsB [Peptococcaceae bacterium]